jgi:hypothetical protein
MEQTITILPTIDISTLQPAGAIQLADGIINAVLSGSVNPLDLPVKKKTIEQALEMAMKNPTVMDCIQEEVRRHGKFATHLGAKIELAEVGTKYHYDVCGDPVMSELLQEQAAINLRIKARETFLKALPPSGEVITIQATGETVHVYPPNKTSTTSIKTTMQK